MLQALGCDGSNDDATSPASQAAQLMACHLTPGTLGPGDHMHACDPQDVKKTTICHIPPGNPANAHTICVGNAAVPAHIQNHGDYFGLCINEPPCPPPTGAGGAPGGTGGAGAGTGGAPGAAGAGGAAGAAGAGGSSIVP
jgi:hypothetical protein